MIKRLIIITVLAFFRPFSKNLLKMTEITHIIESFVYLTSYFQHRYYNFNTPKIRSLWKHFENLTNNANKSIIDPNETGIKKINKKIIIIFRPIHDETRLTNLIHLGHTPTVCLLIYVLENYDSGGCQCINSPAINVRVGFYSFWYILIVPTKYLNLHFCHFFQSHFFFV